MSFCEQLPGAVPLIASLLHFIFIAASFQHLYHLGWTAAMGAGVMLFAHWLYLIAAALEMLDSSGGEVAWENGEELEEIMDGSGHNIHTRAQLIINQHSQREQQLRRRRSGRQPNSQTFAASTAGQRRVSEVPPRRRTAIRGSHSTAELASLFAQYRRYHDKNGGDEEEEILFECSPTGEADCNGVGGIIPASVAEDDVGEGQESKSIPEPNELSHNLAERES